MCDFRRLPLLACLSVVPFALPALRAQTITFAEGTPTSLRIATVPEANPNAPDTVILQDAELLPIEMTGRTLAHELDVTRARRIERNTIVRLELPDGSRLFRYRRSGGQFWGFLHVASDGTPRAVLENSGVGAAQLDDPFADRIAIADDGLHAAIGRTGGGFHVVRLDGGLYTNGRADWLVGGNVDPIPTSVMIGPSCVWYLADGGAGNLLRLWRCDLAEGSTPVDVSPPFVANGDFKDEMAMSRDGAHLVCLYGPQQQQQLWQVGLAGPATVLPPPPGKYEEPGYLPGGPGEPAMLLNDDGSRLFHILADVRDELFLLDTTGQLPALPMTADNVFQPYIGMHILPKFAGASLLVAIGDPAQMDWFSAALSPQGGGVVNLTGTGSMALPFPAGSLDPIQAATIGSKMLIVEQQPGALLLRQLDLATGAQIASAGLLSAPQPGSAVAGVADVLVQTTAGDSLFSGIDSSHMVTLSPGILLTPPVRGPQFSGTWMHLPIQWGIPVFYAPSGFVTLPIEFGLEQIVMTAAGGAVLVGNPVRYLALGTYVTLNRPAAAFRMCLSGAGG